MIIILFLLAVMTGCESEDGTMEIPDQPVTPGKDTTVVEKHDSLTEDSRPSWTVVEDVDPTISSMTFTFVLSDVVVKGEYDTTWTFQPDKTDLVASFINDECRGVTSPVLYDEYLVFLPVAATERDDTYAQLPVTIKYFSSRLKHIFTVKDKILFTKGSSQGSPLNPIVFTWEK